VIPLVNRGRAVGVLAIARTRNNPFTPEEVDFIGEASGQIAVAIENSLAYRELCELKERLAQENLTSNKKSAATWIRANCGGSPALKQVLRLVETVAPTDSTVLLLGETGTGKELIARAVHEHSRRKGPHISFKVNCAAIPTGLLEAKLFGHERGAFTALSARKLGGWSWRMAARSSWTRWRTFPRKSSKLLRALQEQEFERLGSTRTLKVNVRLIAATNRDLVRMVAKGEFRSDLYYRLNVFPIRLPPLREAQRKIFHCSSVILCRNSRSSFRRTSKEYRRL